MENDQRRASDRESFYLISTLEVCLDQFRIKIRNLSPNGALIEGVEGLRQGATARIDIRNIGWVDCTIVWIDSRRAGLRFTHSIDPGVVRALESAKTGRESALDGASPRPMAAQANAGEFYVVRWMKDAAAIAEVRFASLTEAKNHAKDRLGISKIRKGVTAAEVCDLDGVTYFRFE